MKKINFSFGRTARAVLCAAAFLICKYGLKPRRSAAAQVRQRLQRFGIKTLPPNP
jgi:hypothetical protein